MKTNNKSNIIIFQDFKEDKRISMDVYTDSLYNSLKELQLNNCKISLFQPEIPFWISLFSKDLNLMTLRFFRYIIYPIIYFFKSKEHNHIVDQSYSHLLYFSKKNKSIITVHDLIPILAWKGLINGLKYPNYPFLMYFSLRALKRAKFIITVSDSTKKDLINHFHLNESNIKVIHNGISEEFKQYSIQKKKLTRFNLFPNDESKFLILITGNQLYKNHETSFKVIENLQFKSTKELQLVCLGGNKEDLDNLSQRYNIKHSVILFRYLLLDDLIDLYNSVDCLLFPSWYEGFGIPPLEAMACGTPVITSNIPIFKEILGDSALMADPSDIFKLSQHLKILLENDNIRSMYINNGLNSVTMYSWKRNAKCVANLYEQTLLD